MNEKQSEKKSSITSRDFWFRGVHSETPSGEACYFICNYLEERYSSTPEEPPFFTVCSQRNIRVEDPSETCNMECDVFGRCETCRGFSADRCHECAVPRP